MANYYATSTTNYFRVNNEEEYQKLFSNLVSEDRIEDFTFEEDIIVLNGIRNVYNGDAYGDDIEFREIGEEIMVQFGWGNGDEIFGNEWIETRNFAEMKQERINNWNKATEFFKGENENEK